MIVRTIKDPPQQRSACCSHNLREHDCNSKTRPVRTIVAHWQTGWRMTQTGIRRQQKRSRLLHYKKVVLLLTLHAASFAVSGSCDSTSTLEGTKGHILEAWACKGAEYAHSCHEHSYFPCFFPEWMRFAIIWGKEKRTRVISGLIR